MPAYNSEATIASAIESLLAQTLTSFELVVSDNASTDGTAEIVQDFARRDARVRLDRLPQNVGANLNYSRVAQAPRAEYFKWASSNDWCAPTFLESCVAVLDSRPDVAVAAPRTRTFESDVTRAVDYVDDIEAVDEDPVRRFVQVMTELRLNNVVNGVIRVSALRRTSYVEHFRQSDIVLIAHLALLGKLVLLDQPLFYRRLEPKSATKLMSADAVHRHHYPRRTARALFPAWRRSLALLEAVVRTDLKTSQRARALVHTARMSYWQKHELFEDFKSAVTFVTAAKD